MGYPSGSHRRSQPIPNATATTSPFLLRTRRGLSWTIYLAIALGLILAVALVGASALLASRNGEALRHVTRTQDTRAALATVLSALEGAETGQRGYLLTGKDSYLDPYRAGVRDAPAALDRLEAAFRDAGPAATPETTARRDRDMTALRRAAADKLDELASTLRLVGSGDRAGSLDLVQSDRGERAMNEIRAIVARFEAEQQGILGEQIEVVNRAGQLLILADALGFVLLAALAGAIAWGAWRTFKALRGAQAELEAAYQALSGANETLEDRVRQRTAALTEANEEIQRFAYIVSHDLRAPLVNIMGFTSEMESAADTLSAFVASAAAVDPAGTRDVVAAAHEDIPESIRFIKASTAKMDRLIGAILKLSREGRRVLTSEPVAMAPLLEGIAASLRHQSEERGATIVIEAVPDLSSDRLVLEQVFSNLMENALKYQQSGRPVRIVARGRLEGRLAVFEVEDNGRGIATRDLERVFELFRRAGDQSVPGEGIGLAHVRALVRRLGGRIDCVSREGVGSTFRVVLPRVRGPTDEEHTES